MIKQASNEYGINARAGTSVTESENPVTALCSAYERLGLEPGDAWDAAQADFRLLCERWARARFTT